MSTTRRGALKLMAAAAATPILPAGAGRLIELKGGAFQPINVAVAPFVGDDNARLATSVIVNNFKRSVFLNPIDSSSLGPNAAPPDAIPNLEAFRGLNAQFVVTGRAQRAGDGRAQIAFRLFDATTGQQVTGTQFSADAASARLRRRERAQESAAQASRHHGSGRRQCALSHSRR
jgi:TolB protein